MSVILSSLLRKLHYEWYWTYSELPRLQLIMVITTILEKKNYICTVSVQGFEIKPRGCNPDVNWRRCASREGIILPQNKIKNWAWTSLWLTLPLCDAMLGSVLALVTQSRVLGAGSCLSSCRGSHSNFVYNSLSAKFKPKEQIQNKLVNGIKEKSKTCLSWCWCGANAAGRSWLIILMVFVPYQ